MIISLGAEKNLGQNPAPFHDKDLGEISDTRDIPKHNKDNKQQKSSQPQTKRRESQCNSTQIRNKTRLSSLSIPIESIVLEVLTRAIR